MKPVFANSAWVAARENHVLHGGRRVGLHLRVRYGLVLHPEAGPVLIDTGYTPHVVRGHGRGNLLRFYNAILRPSLNDAEQPAELLARFGFRVEDVRYVIVSHFHADHISGLSMFPSARFIASGDAWLRVKARSTLGNLRHGIFPELFPADFGERLISLSSLQSCAPHDGFPGGADLFGDGSMIAVDLPGHADGHFGILFTAMKKPLLYGVDAQWMLRAVKEDRTPGYPARLVAADYSAVGRSSALLRRFVASGGELMFCHDPAPAAYDLAPECEA